jgi:hypothetical protein
MDDAIAVALELSPELRFGLRIAAATGLLVVGRIGRERVTGV